MDGIISQDPLGLDRIYVQEKRYAGVGVQSAESVTLYGLDEDYFETL